MTFNYDKDVVVIAQSDTVITEILTKIKQAFSSLPFFLQPGFIRWSSKGFALDNGCRLTIGIASESVVQGFSLDFVFIDEFAYLGSIAEKFWKNIYPSLSNNPNSKCIIASTPNGRNLFYHLWTNALLKKNRFVTNRIYWYDVPGRDEQFKQDTIDAIGISGWEMGYELSFDTTISGIFSTQVQKGLREQQVKYENEWSHKYFDFIDVVSEYNIEFINPDILPYNLKDDYFLFGIDIAEGLGKDYSVLKIRKIVYNKEKERLDFPLIACFQNNTIDVSDFADMVLKLTKHFDIDKIRIILETNTYGGEFINQIKNRVTYEWEKYSFFNLYCIPKFEDENILGEIQFDRYKVGIKWNFQNKKMGVRSFQKMINNGQFDGTHFASVEEYLNFGQDKNGNYKAQYGNDDLVMSDVCMAHFVNVNNNYSRSFLSDVEYILKQQLLEKEILLENPDYYTEIKTRENIIDSNMKQKGYTLRNHEEHYNSNNKSGNQIIML